MRLRFAPFVIYALLLCLLPVPAQAHDGGGVFGGAIFGWLGTLFFGVPISLGILTGTKRHKFAGIFGGLLASFLMPFLMILPMALGGAEDLDCTAAAVFIGYLISSYFVNVLVQPRKEGATARWKLSLIWIGSLVAVALVFGSMFMVHYFDTLGAHYSDRMMQQMHMPRAWQSH
jgi:hypothetical protein